MLHRQPDHRNHVCNDQDEVLSHLSPSYSTHTTQERADQNTGQAHIDTHLKRQTSQSGSDQAYAEDLSYDVNEGHQNGRKHTNQTCHVAAVTRAKEVRNGELAKLTQVRRQEQGHQTVAASPAQNKG